MIARLLLGLSMTFSAVHAAELRYLALGDSYTIGESVAEAERWPMQLATSLRGEGIALADPRIIATTGWTTDELSAAMDAAEPLGRWDFVTLLIGVNDQYRARPVQAFEHEFDTLLARAIALTGHRADRVLVLTIPDWGVTPFGANSGRDRAQIAAQLDAYNTAVMRTSESRSVLVADIAPVSRARGGELVADDGLHPSGELYAEWTKAALPYARRLLGHHRSR